MLRILYHPNSEHERAVIDYVRDFKRFTGKDIEQVSLDTPEGAHLAKLYDIVRYPCIIATADGDKLLKDWQGLPLPVINEVSYYASEYYTT